MGPLKLTIITITLYLNNSDAVKNAPIAVLAVVSLEGKARRSRAHFGIPKPMTIRECRRSPWCS